MNMEDVKAMTEGESLNTPMALSVADAVYAKGWWIAIPSDGAEATLDDAKAAIKKVDGAAIDVVVPFEPDYCDSVRVSGTDDGVFSVYVLCNTATPSYTCSLETLTGTIWKAVTEYNNR
tara:strand:- start:3382 stop:3738 length:357 start_codon:yes stop_codon:yes gene_type:complete